MAEGKEHLSIVICGEQRACLCSQPRQGRFAGRCSLAQLPAGPAARQHGTRLCLVDCSPPSSGSCAAGHVDSGKSTTTGRLLFELGGIPERELEKLKEEAAALGKQSFAFAFYMDRQKEERERGVTIACTTKEFFTDKWHYTIIDAPGHRCVCVCVSCQQQLVSAHLLAPAAPWHCRAFCMVHARAAATSTPTNSPTNRTPPTHLLRPHHCCAGISSRT